MTAFLKQVAKHYWTQSKVEGSCFIFPNQRSKVFFKKWLCQEISQAQSGPVVTPVMMTMNDFFYRLASASKTDRIVLLLELYDIYKELNPLAESLDDFIFWGDVILADFDDVDKYLVDVRMLFSNVSDFKNIQDNFTYLSEAQIEAIRRFMSHFQTGSQESNDKEEYKLRFLRIWEILYGLYSQFNERLESKGLDYEGRVYRRTAQRLQKEGVSDLISTQFPECKRFIFVGLNALNECERLALKKLRDAHLAEFCWDFSSDMIRHSANKSSLFLSRNIEDFPQAFSLDPEGLVKPQINVLSVPGGIAMAKQLVPIISTLPQKVVGLETAIVLPDEGLLIPTLNSIPSHISKLNVSMGYPMNGSELWGLMNDIASLQLHLRQKDGQWMFYHRQVWSIFSNSVFKSIVSDNAKEIIQAIRSATKYYIPQEDFLGDPTLELIFRPIVKDIASTDPKTIIDIADYQQGILSAIGLLLKDIPGMNIELDFARVYYLSIDKLRIRPLSILPATYFRLLAQLIGKTSVPFKGEPLEGLQIIGPLETRALDFENLIILSCNEGIFPKRSLSSSLIPPELRKGFGLPTYEFQDAVWAYYFYRMIQRAKTVWMLFDSRTEGIKGGEESRYIKQLELHFALDIKRYVVKTPLEIKADTEDIVKTKEHIDIIKESYLSASSLQQYLSCPMKFFYHVVEKLREDKEVNESLDAGSIGTAFHSVMQILYSGRKTITLQYIKSLLSKTEEIRKLVTEQIMIQLHSIELTGRNLLFEDMVYNYVLQTLKRDAEFLENTGTAFFEIHGLELELFTKICGYKFKGFIDRLDSIGDGGLRVVDYKTGKVSDEEFLINAANAEKVVEKLFGPKEDSRPKIALQLYIYDKLVSSQKEWRHKPIINSIYSMSRLFTNGVENVEQCEEFCTRVDDRIKELFAEIEDLNIPWTRYKGGDKGPCSYCDFKIICGR